MTRLIQEEDERLIGRRSQWQLRAQCLLCFEFKAFQSINSYWGKGRNYSYFTPFIYSKAATPLQSKLFSVTHMRIIHAQSDYPNTQLNITGKDTSTSALIG